MKILVCLSHVPDTTSKINFNPTYEEFDSTGVQFVINPNDEFGLTKAIFLKEKFGGSVTVLNVGDISTEPTLRKALAIGADDAIRVNHIPKDSYNVACQIAEVVKQNNYDVIICGRESIDYNSGLVPGMLAELLNIPFINSCIGFEPEGSNANLIREIDGGEETLSSTMPLVIGGQKGLVNENDLKIPNMRGIMTARSKPLKILDAIDVNSKTTSISFNKTEKKAACKFIDADKVEELIDLLHNEAKVI